MATRRKIGPVERAARKDLRGVEEPFRSSGVALAYLDAAARMDMMPPPTDRDAVALSREMRLCYMTLHELSPNPAEEDDVDEFTRRREQRMQGTA